MSNTNQNMSSHELELESQRLNRILAELKENYTNKKESNDRLEASLNACGRMMQAANELGAKAEILHNELVDGYKTVHNKLNADIATINAIKGQNNVIKEMKSEILDEEIAKAEREKIQLTADLKQLEMNEANYKKNVEDLRAQVKEMEAENEKISKKEKTVLTSELDSSQKNLTQSDERLMDIHGIEQISFLDRYFADAANIEQESVKE